MPIKPIDMQVAVPRSLEASKVNSEELSRTMAIRQNQAISVQKKAENEMKQVYNPKNIEKMIIHSEKENERNKYSKDNGKQKGNRNKKQSEMYRQDKKVQGESGARLDIRL
ncbi:MAG TPA: hypothetical protein GXX49_08835 [Clostridiaceae bacterium]|jgi:Tfp pilus assembly protein FimT|nr:hypothetical protein [Clostridiaceae bacterium]